MSSDIREPDSCFAEGSEPVPSSDSLLESRGAKRDLLNELRTSWQDGDPVPPEDVLARWPGDPDSDPDVASLLFEDFCQRQLHGEEPSVQEYAERFPGREDSLKGLLNCQQFLRSVGSLDGLSNLSDTSLQLPSVQDELFGFRLRQELGYGAFARVFLADQIDLASRPVVLKVSAICGNEPQTLAQLQHTHIVPIYSLHDDARAGLRAVCMPYFGGAPLGRVLQSLWTGTRPPTEGSQLVNTLSSVSTPGAGVGTPSLRVQFIGHGPDLEKTEQTPLGVLRGLSYVQSAAWITARLAEALQHAHDRGVLHRDIKPSNILLGADGQPMLLDFNLARSAFIPETHATLGGTVAYMAPEHLRALATADPELCARVDHRSDLYSLGMVLYEMLVGQSPFATNASYSPRKEMIEEMAVERTRGLSPRARFGLAIPRSLESIVRKCLAPDPAERYQQAEHLAEDLRRFLDDRPLRYAPELSWTERAAKWMRRHPRLTSSGTVGTVAAVLLLAVGATLVGIWLRLDAAEAQKTRKEFADGTTQALCLGYTRTDLDDLDDRRRQGLQKCAETLAKYQVLERDDWQDQRAWQRLDPADRQRLAEDARELLLLLASGRVREAPQDADALRKALVLLDRAEAIRDLPPSQALWWDRATYLRRLGKTEEAGQAEAKATQTPPASAYDHYLLACSYARQGTRNGYAQAVAQLDRALQIKPQHYWSLVERGICHQELGEYALAVSDYSTCIGLWPDFALGHYNRGCALVQMGKQEEAIADFTAALGCDKNLVVALLNRGLARLEVRQYEPALADFDEATSLGRDDAFVHAGRGVALEGLGRHADADAAFAAAFARAETVPAARRNRLRWVYGFAVSARLAEKAREAFDAVLREEPNHPQALYGRAMLLITQDRLDEALRWLNRAVEANPGFVDARRARAIVLARKGRLVPACQDMDWCRAREPNAGVTLYAAACVDARIAEKTADPEVARRAADQAVEFVRQALERGYGRDKAADDPDLAAVRDHPLFRRLFAVNHSASPVPSGTGTAHP
jgi:serine/threonine protein kinase/Flp pilus assembly protein TadD